MSPDTFTYADFLLIFAVVVSSFLLGCVHRLVRGLGSQREQPADAGTDVRELLKCFDQQKADVIRMRKEMALLKSLLEADAAAASAAGTSSPARSAARSKSKLDPRKLARAGLGVETLMARCRLSRAEAELVHSVHGAERKRAAA